MEYRTLHPLVVVADDDPDICRLVGTLLARWGYATARVTTGWEALAAVERFAPTFVVLDVDVPTPDGIALTRMLKSNPRHGHVPVLLLTAHADPARAEEGIAAGAAGYLTKPFHAGALQNAIAPLVPAVVRPAA
ncbi:MAG TPA: response regulator [Gaiellaceae bacterium]|nr:response regulator [Gaiellaceae bacterium]